jgi:hypothetical protein
LRAANDPTTYPSSSVAATQARPWFILSQLECRFVHSRGWLSGHILSERRIEDGWSSRFEGRLFEGVNMKILNYHGIYHVIHWFLE